MRGRSPGGLETRWGPQLQALIGIVSLWLCPTLPVYPHFSRSRTFASSALLIYGTHHPSPPRSELCFVPTDFFSLVHESHFTTRSRPFTPCKDVLLSNFLAIPRLIFNASSSTPPPDSLQHISMTFRATLAPCLRSVSCLALQLLYCRNSVFRECLSAVLSCATRLKSLV